jgi:hypothetical protein
MKKIFIVIVSAVILILLISACGAPKAQEEAAMEADRGVGGGYGGVMAEAPMAEMPILADVSAEMGAAGEDSMSSADSYLSAERLIVRNGDINMEVNDTRQTRDDIRAIVNKLSEQGAFILSTNEYGSNIKDNPNISIVIRIPADAFDNVMEQIADMADVVNSRNENSEDVTEEYYDLENRLGSLEAARQRLLEIMENADNTEDLLKAEQQLTERETEIESLKGRQKFLSESAHLSRITVSLQPYILAQPIDTSWKPLETIRQAVDDLIAGTKGFIDFLLYFIIAVAPWLALFGYIIWRVIKYFRRRNKRKKAEED